MAKGKFVLVYAGYDVKVSNKNNEQYMIVNFLDSTGKPFQTITRNPDLMASVSGLDRFSEYEIVIDVVQGKYPKYELSAL